MALTSSQIKLLKSLKMGEWVKNFDLPRGTSISSILALISHEKVVAVGVKRLNQMTDDDVEKGFVQLEIENITYRNTNIWPYFVKKIDDTIETNAECDIESLKEKMKQLELKIESMSKQ